MPVELAAVAFAPRCRYQEHLPNHSQYSENQHYTVERLASSKMKIRSLLISGNLAGLTTIQRNELSSGIALTQFLS